MNITIERKVRTNQITDEVFLNGGKCFWGIALLGAYPPHVYPFINYRE